MHRDQTVTQTVGHLIALAQRRRARGRGVQLSEQPLSP